MFVGARIPLAHGAEVTFHIIDQKQQPVSDAVISLVSLGGGTDVSTVNPAPDAPIAEIQQQNQEFSPYVTVIRAGTAVRLPNRDTVAHHVYSESPAKRFEFPLYAPGKAETVTFDKPGVVALGCNIHDWMVAYIVIVDTPWHAQTKSGAATLPSVPSGRYRCEIWHPRLSRVQTRELTIDATAAMPAVEISLTLKPDQRIRRSSHGPSGGYR